MPWEILDIESLLIAGDLNVTLRSDECWGNCRRNDPLGERLQQEFLSRNLVDIRPGKMTPSWDNNTTGQAYIAKRIDCFIVNASIIAKWGMPRSHTGIDFTSDHRPIFLKWKEKDYRLGYSFKFNRVFLEDQSFNEAIGKKWKELQESDMALFTTFREKIQSLRVVAKDWQIHKKRRDKQALNDIQKELRIFLNSINLESMSFDQKNHIRKLGQVKQTLLQKEEASWRLKCRAIWLREGDRNMKYFHNFANARRSKNSIWKIQDGKGGFFYS